jgi:type VI secretion system secreted protein VgrG
MRKTRIWWIFSDAVSTAKTRNKTMITTGGVIRAPPVPSAPIRRIPGRVGALENARRASSFYARRSRFSALYSEIAMADEKYTQDNRLFSISTPLGKDKLLLKRVSGAESLGSLFAYEASLLSEDNEIGGKSILGKEVTITLKSPVKGGGTRYINGIVSAFGRTGNTATLARYTAIIVPKLWLASLTTDCRIFQKKNAKDILSEIIKTDAGITDYKDSVSGSGTRERPYCVQFRESDFAFASRLMEEEGIYYHFLHADGKHTLVLCDAPGSHSTASAAATVSFHNRRRRRNEQGVLSWSVRNALVSGALVLADYNYLTPATSLRSNATESNGHAGDDAELFDYPGMFAAGDVGEKLASIRLGAHQARREVYTGLTSAVTLATGCKFTLAGHPVSALNQDYLVIGNEILAENPPYTDGELSRDSTFRSRITAIPASRQYRPPRTTPVPDLRGPHSAVVTGAENDEIHTDKHGCVKVRFHWDRDDKKKGEDSTVYLRAAQMWTGKNWGALFIPRVGQEVIVEFLDGHPDRPVITGCLYNETNLPPYALPDHKTRSAIRTQTTPDGGKYNEIRFEDKKDAEQLLLHAAKDHEIIIANDRVEQVGNESHRAIQGDTLELLNKDHHLTIAGSQHVTIGVGAQKQEGDANIGDGSGEGEKAKEGGGQFLAIKGPRVIEITGDKAKSSLHVEGDAGEKFDKNYSTAVTEQRYIKAKELILEGAENITLKVGGTTIALTSDGIQLKTSGEIVLDAGKDITIKSGAGIAQKASQNVAIEAGQNAGLKGTAGVKIESSANLEAKAGANLALEGTAQATMKGNAKLGLEGGAMAELKASGILTLQGALVNIN